MASLSKIVIHPVALGRAFFLPFAHVIGGYAALLAALYLLVGVDPTVPVGHFVFDSAEAVLPLTGRLAAVWVFYCVFYLLLGLHDRDQRVAALFLSRVAEIWERRGFQSGLQPALSARPVTSLLLFRLLRKGLPLWLATRWRAGDSVPLEYD